MTVDQRADGYNVTNLAKRNPGGTRNDRMRRDIVLMDVDSLKKSKKRGRIYFSEGKNGDGSIFQKGTEINPSPFYFLFTF
jgi:hypothetical protein